MSIPTVVCVLFDGKDILPDYSGGVYDWNWVERLYKGVKSNCFKPFRFLCLTDLPPDNPSPGIDIAPLLDSSEGWMCLNEVYRPDLDIERGIFMGLDTVIVGDITHILGWDGNFGVTRSPYGDNNLCNPITCFSREWGDWLWRVWSIRRSYWRKRCSSSLGPDLDPYPSELVYLRLNYHPEWTYLDDLWPNQIVSYKVHGTSDESRIIYFHGDPKPHQIDDPMIRENWI